MVDLGSRTRGRVSWKMWCKMLCDQSTKGGGESSGVWAWLLRGAQENPRDARVYLFFVCVVGLKERTKDLVCQEPSLARNIPRRPYIYHRHTCTHAEIQVHVHNHTHTHTQKCTDQVARDTRTHRKAQGQIHTGAHTCSGMCTDTQTYRGAVPLVLPSASHCLSFTLSHPLQSPLTQVHLDSPLTGRVGPSPSQGW